jgi:hypothetical protein
VYCSRCGTPNNEVELICVGCGLPLSAVPPPPPPLEDEPGMRWVLPVGRSGLAIAAGYVGLIGIFIPLFGPVAIVLGILAVRDMKRNPEKHGMGRVIFAFIASGFGTLVTTGFLVIYLLMIGTES